MKIGEKIREARVARGLTQAQLCKGKITRNMLSVIENGKATPSLDTLGYIAHSLKLPISYFLEEDTSPFTYKKSAAIDNIKSAYKQERYLDCIKLIDDIGEVDDELALMLAHAYNHSAKQSLFRGALLTASKMFDLCQKYCNLTIYSTAEITAPLPLYLAIVNNIQSPLLELDTKKLESNAQFNSEYEFYKYVTLDSSFSFKTELYAKHIKAKSLIKDREYSSALKILRELENSKSQYTYNAYAYFSIYSDMENCFRQLADFENAYRYSSKRLSMLEGFKS